LQVLDEWQPDMMFIDAGFGADIVDYLRDDLGYENVSAIAFNSTPLNEKKYKNKRAEMYGTMSEWLKNENEQVDVPDDDGFQADVCACPYSADLDNRIIILPKVDIKKKLGFSPDIGDAAALTFADRVVPKSESFGGLRRSSGNWRAM